jgi:hypothetical protein
MLRTIGSFRKGTVALESMRNWLRLYRLSDRLRGGARRS